MQYETRRHGLKTRDDYIELCKKRGLGSEMQKIYPEFDIDYDRYENLLSKLPENKETWIVSAPGRTELAGNHTDHNNGRVLAASVSLDTVAAVQKRGDNTVLLISEGYPVDFIVDLNSLEPLDEEKNTTLGLIRGIAGGLKERGYSIGGFQAYVHSNVPPGSGLSSSASIEILLGSIFSHIYNDGRIPPVVLAQTGQFAENRYFGKPSGLMDQLACAVGGVICIDFENSENPVIESADADFSGYSLMIVNTGGSHADLTPQYASIPKEMSRVAGLFGRSVCRGISFNELLLKYNEIRKISGDRAFLRVLHYLNENRRVTAMFNALRRKDMKEYLATANESGNSSFKYLQNCYSPENTAEQGIPVALALTETYLKDRSFACRVHGGGFAGTIQVYVPEELSEEYITSMESTFGKDSVCMLAIRDTGAYCFE